MKSKVGADILLAYLTNEGPEILKSGETLVSGPYISSLSSHVAWALRQASPLSLSVSGPYLAYFAYFAIKNIK
jgi:hypothetical protein